MWRSPTPGSSCPGRSSPTLPTRPRDGSSPLSTPSRTGEHGAETTCGGMPTDQLGCRPVRDGGSASEPDSVDPLLCCEEAPMARVVILGAGISGHTAALHLKRRLKRSHEVIVVSPNANWNWIPSNIWVGVGPVSYTHLRAHETDSYLVCRLLLEKKKKKNNRKHRQI